MSLNIRSFDMGPRDNSRVSRTSILFSSVCAGAALYCSTTPPPTAPEVAATNQPSAASECGLPIPLLSRGWPRSLSPTDPSEPQTGAGGYTIAILPDTQYYALCRYEHARTQAAWLVQEQAKRNLQAVIHLGDLTESNTPQEWAFMSEALSPATKTFPTFLATGNHDHGDLGAANRRFTRFLDYFGTPAPPTASALKETFEPGNVENAYYRVTLPRVTLGVLVLEWSPRAQTVAWANRTLETYGEDRVIVVTHAYLYYDSTRYDWAAKGGEQEWNPNSYGTSGVDPALSSTTQGPRRTSELAYDGQRLWDELVSLHPSVFMTLSGHVLGDGTGQLSTRGEHDNLVHQVLVNFQMLEQGGLGYLRLLELDPAGDRLLMKTYSPSLKAWATAPDQSFELELVPPLWQ